MPSSNDWIDLPAAFGRAEISRQFAFERSQGQVATQRSAMTYR